MKNFFSKSFISALMICSQLNTGAQAAQAGYETTTPFVMPAYQPQDTPTPSTTAPLTEARETDALGVIGALLRSIPILNGKAAQWAFPKIAGVCLLNEGLISGDTAAYTITLDFDSLDIDTSNITASAERKSFNMYTPGYNDATVTEQRIEAIVSSATTAMLTVFMQKYNIIGLNKAPLKQFFVMFCKNYIRTLDLQTENSVQQAVILASRFFSESINSHYLTTEPTNIRKWFRPVVGICAVLRTLVIHKLVQDKAAEEGSVEKVRENGTWRDLVIGLPLNILGEWVNNLIFKSATA